MEATDPAQARQRRCAAIQAWQRLPLAIRRDIIRRAKRDEPADPEHRQIAVDFSMAEAEPDSRLLIATELWVVACALVGVALVAGGADILYWPLAAMAAPLLLVPLRSASERIAASIGSANLRALTREAAAGDDAAAVEGLVVASRPVDRARTWLPVITVAWAVYLTAAAGIPTVRRDGWEPGRLLADLVVSALLWGLAALYPLLRRIDPRIVRRPRRPAPMIAIDRTHLRLPCVDLTVAWSQVAAVDVDAVELTDHDGVLVAFRFHRLPADGVTDRLAMMLRRHGAIRFAARDLNVDPLLLVAASRRRIAAAVRA